jgi:peptide/nickel transport system substrate-binding protein
MTRGLAGLCALLVTFALGSVPGFAATPHQLSYSDGLDISSLNPFIATSGNITALDELTAAELFRFDAKGNPIPELATEVPSKANRGISADGLTITFHLRHGVKWSDGAPFDAGDVVYSYRVAVDPANLIANPEPWSRLKGVDATDNYTVVFHFKAPYALFLQDYFTTLSGSSILPKHLLGPGTAINQAAYNAKPVGIGPFRYTAYNRGDDVEMEANPYYWRGKPKLQKIDYKIVTDDNTLYTQLQTGELDLWDLINGVLAQRVKTLPGKTYQTRLSNYMGAIFFNERHAAVADPRVRLALEYATDRNLVIDKVMLRNEIATQSVVPLTSVDTIKLPFTPYDLKRAAQLLDRAGWKAGAGGMRSKNGTPLAVDLAIPSGYEPSAIMSNILHDDWGKIGVNVLIHTYATAQYFAIYSAGGIIQTGKFDAALYSAPLGPLYANINGTFDCASIPPHGGNADFYCNPKVDALNNRYSREFDAANRHAQAGAIQRLINDDTPVIVTGERIFLSSYDSHLHGYHPNSYSYWGDPLQLDM